MTEAEWLACNDLKSLVKSQEHTGKDRKQRLFACAVARLVWDRFTTEPLRLAIETAERFADSSLNGAELDAIYQDCFRAYREGNRAWDSFILTGTAVVMPDAARAASCMSVDAHGVLTPPGPSRMRRGIALEVLLVALFRDVFGNPFQPVSFSPEWRTDTAIALARMMYDAREFYAMPILADALQDAGCDSDDILQGVRTMKS